MTAPPGYARVAVGGADALAWEPAAEWLEDLLARGERLHGWARAARVAERDGGRAAVPVVRAPARGPDGRERWAVRHYARGGAARALGDLYARLGSARPWRELGASHEARARGVPTPAVVAGAAYPAGPFYRADLATELVPGARSLYAILLADGNARGASRWHEPDRGAELELAPEPVAAEVALRLAGRLVRRLEEARVLHRDLNAHNVLIAGGEAGPEAWVVDLDRCAVLSGAAPAAGRMRERLRRSLRKLGAARGRPFSAAEWEALRSGFEEP
ncbi:MAG TPA: lipopolysaccharide kinase InaA family protein [Longimicrobiales bacterium]|nr:lipopolysaccharide kinase InaA family protein [Longimicrobiales bacterium]